jgi:phospholipase/carboxylesterase
MSLLPAIIRETGNKDAVDAAVIWLHGLGADGSDFLPIIPELGLPADMSIRFIFPNAPSMPVTINQGFRMPAWYDIREMAIERKVDESQLRQSAAEVHKFIDAQIAEGIASERIILAGFSQGGAVVMEAGLSCEHKLGGILSLSSYFPTVDSIHLSEANRSIPVRVCHGSLDPVVQESLGKKAVSDLERFGYHVEYSSYPMQHAVCPQEIEDIAQWFKTRLG